MIVVSRSHKKHHPFAHPFDTPIGFRLVVSLDALNDELLFSHPVVDEAGRGLVWTGKIEEQLPPPAQSTIAPYLHNLLSLAVEDDVFPKLTSEHVRRRTVEALNTLVT